MTQKITIIIDCDDDEYCKSVINMLAFMAEPKALRQWKAEIKIEKAG